MDAAPHRRGGSWPVRVMPSWRLKRNHEIAAAIPDLKKTPIPGASSQRRRAPARRMTWVSVLVVMAASLIPEGSPAARRGIRFRHPENSGIADVDRVGRSQ